MSTAAPDPERDSAEGRREERSARRATRLMLLKVNLSTFAKTATIPKSTRVIN